IPDAGHDTAGRGRFYRVWRAICPGVGKQCRAVLCVHSRTDRRKIADLPRNACLVIVGEGRGKPPVRPIATAFGCEADGAGWGTCDYRQRAPNWWRRRADAATQVLRNFKADGRVLDLLWVGRLR